MRRAFTLLDVLCVLAIIGLLATLMYPSVIKSREQALQTVTISRLRQMGIALNLYRSEYGGIDQGTPAEMGLPELSPSRQLKLQRSETSCAVARTGSFLNVTLYLTARNPDSRVAESQDKEWASLSSVYGGRMPFAGMLCHNEPRLSGVVSYEPILGLGVQADGGLIRKFQRGVFGSLEWWLPEGKTK